MRQHVILCFLCLSGLDHELGGQIGDDLVLLAVGGHEVSDRPKLRERHFGKCRVWRHLSRNYADFRAGGFGVGLHRCPSLLKKNKNRVRLLFVSNASRHPTVAAYPNLGECNRTPRVPVGKVGGTAIARCRALFSCVREQSCHARLS